MKAGKLSGFAVLAAVGAFGLAINASALEILPSSAVLWGNETGVPAIEAAIEQWLLDEGIDCEISEAYKADVPTAGNPIVETGAFAANYTTTFSNSATEPSNALIEWDGPDYILSDCIYLLVKNGASDPAWYLFDLNAAGWDGKADLDLQGFWLNNDGDEGRISHVAIYAGEGKVQVPDGGMTVMLMGLGLAGLALARRIGL